jgi:hypothetical protein
MTMNQHFEGRKSQALRYMQANERAGKLFL